MGKIKFTFEDKSIQDVIVNDFDIDKSLLDIAHENKIDLNHNCGEVCACSTCHIYVNKGAEFVEEISDQEEDFIDRAISPRMESRLGCQAVVLDKDAEIEVEIPDQRQIIGHEH